MIGILILTITAFVCGICISLISNQKQENKSEIYLKYLPGYNCGSCGYGSCKGMSEAMEIDPSVCNKCRPLRGDAKTKMEDVIKEIN